MGELMPGIRYRPHGIREHINHWLGTRRALRNADQQFHAMQDTATRHVRMLRWLAREYPEIEIPIAEYLRGEGGE